MKWNGEGKIEMEENEPAMRSCWECNQAHEHLKQVNVLHVCFDCGRYWVYDRFLSSFDSDEAFDAYFRAQGLEPGDSTTKIDKGYRVCTVSIDDPVALLDKLKDDPTLAKSINFSSRYGTGNVDGSSST